MLSHWLLQKASGACTVSRLEMVRQALKLSVKYLKSRATVYFDKKARHLAKAGHFFGLVFFRYKTGESKAYALSNYL